MEVYLNRVDGWDDAITSLYLSKRTLTKELENKIRFETATSTNTLPADGKAVGRIENPTEFFIDGVKKFLKWCPVHITMGRFLDFSFSVYGMHRAGQDDVDSHAKRMENRVLRSSTRLADFKDGEMSDFYKGKILTTDTVLRDVFGKELPERIEVDGKTYVKTVNGYILEEYKDNRDVKRGLYMLSIPSNFIFKANLTEFAHIYKERNIHGTANPEVKEAIENAADLLEDASAGLITRELLMKIKN